MLGVQTDGKQTQTDVASRPPQLRGGGYRKKTHYVAVNESAGPHSVRAFGCFTDELADMAAWLDSCAVDVVAMEATGVYWIPVYEVLDRAGFEVHLVDARATKQARTTGESAAWARTFPLGEPVSSSGDSSMNGSCPGTV